MYRRVLFPRAADAQPAGDPNRVQRKTRLSHRSNRGTLGRAQPSTGARLPQRVLMGYEIVRHPGIDQFRSSINLMLFPVTTNTRCGDR